MVRSPRQASPNPDIYDPDDVGLRNSPLKEMHIKLQPSPSPPPLIGPNRLSPISTPSSVTRRKGPKQKSKPCLGDASIINSMDGGKHPDLARKAGNEPLASDDEDTDHSMRGTEVEIKAAAVKREPNGIDLTALAADALRAHEGRASQEPLQQAEDRDDDVMMDGSTTPNGTTIIRPRSREAERALQPRSISYVDVQSTNTPDSSIKSEPHPTSAGELPPLQRQSSIPGMPVGNGARPIRLPSISSQLGALSHIDPAVTGEQSSNAQTPPASLQRPRYAPPTSQPSTPRSPSAAACPLPSPGQASNQFYYDQGPHRTMSQATAYQYPSMVDYNSSNTDGVVLRQGSVPPSSAPPINRMSIDGITNPQVGAFKCNFPGCKSSFSTQVSRFVEPKANLQLIWIVSSQLTCQRAFFEQTTLLFGARLLKS